MSPDVHASALRAALRLTVSLAVLSGCSTPAEDGSASNESNLDKSNASTAPDHQHPDTPECAAKLAAELPNMADWNGSDINLSHDAALCCHDRLIVGGYDFMCCSATDATTGQSAGAGTGMACSPWGPPVPPSMKRGLKNRMVA